MDDRGEPKTKVTEDGKVRKSDREVQRAEALRANLLRRKTQARGRVEGIDRTAEKPGGG
jgi:hypothetical protein